METKNLQIIIETVEMGNNGYPRGIRNAVVGFTSYEEAADFAERVNGEVQKLHKRYGWSYPERCGWTTSAFDMSEVFEDEENIYLGDNLPDEEDFFKQEVAVLMENSSSFDEFDKKYQELKNMWGKISNLADDEMIAYDSYFQISYEGDRYTIEYDYDSNIYSIGVVAELEDIEQEL